MADVLRQLVGIFWDGENVAIPKGYDTALASNDVDRAVCKYGCVSEKFYYFDSNKEICPLSVRGKLDGAGYKLVDCPSRMQGHKETVDKKIIVDIMWFVIQHHKPDVLVTLVLISGDGDFSYMISKLKGMGIQIIVIFPDDRSKASQLFNAASVALNWKHDVLQGFSNLPKSAIPVLARWSDWSTDEVAEWLQSKGLEEVVPVFRKQKIDGSVLKVLTKEHLKEMGLTAIGDHVRILAAISGVRSAHGSSQERSSSGRQAPSHGEGDGAAGPSTEVMLPTDYEDEGVEPHGDEDRDEPSAEELEENDQTADAFGPMHWTPSLSRQREQKDDASCTQMKEGRADVFLNCVLQNQQLRALPGNTQPRHTWVTDSAVALMWYENYGKDRIRYVSQRDTALSAGFVERNPKIEHLAFRLTMSGWKRSQGCEDDKTVVPYRMELCWNYESSGHCWFGSSCHFAHEAEQVRNCPSRECSICRELEAEGQALEEGFWCCINCLNDNAGEHALITDPPSPEAVEVAAHPPQLPPPGLDTTEDLTRRVQVDKFVDTMARARLTFRQPADRQQILDLGPDHQILGSESAVICATILPEKDNDPNTAFVKWKNGSAESLLSAHIAQYVEKCLLSNSVARSPEIKVQKGRHMSRAVLTFSSSQDRDRLLDLDCVHDIAGVDGVLIQATLEPDESDDPCKAFLKWKNKLRASLEADAILVHFQKFLAPARHDSPVDNMEMGLDLQPAANLPTLSDVKQPGLPSQSVLVNTSLTRVSQAVAIFRNPEDMHHVLQLQLPRGHVIPAGDGEHVHVSLAPLMDKDGHASIKWDNKIPMALKAEDIEQYLNLLLPTIESIRKSQSGSSRSRSSSGRRRDEASSTIVAGLPSASGSFPMLSDAASPSFVAGSSVASGSRPLLPLDDHLIRSGSAYQRAGHSPNSYVE